MLLVTTMTRCSLHRATRRRDAAAAQVLLLPVRALLSLWLWAWSFLIRRVQWHDAVLDVARDGSVRLLERA
jgi:hypothetical protein